MLSFPLISDQTNDDQRRDKLLLRLLKTPPQPRPKRERGKRSIKDETNGSTVLV